MGEAGSPVEPTNRVTVVIVDDEEAARLRLRRLLERQSDVSVVGEAGSGRDALSTVRELRPDLVFLDVQMPGLSGFEVLEELAPDELPAVIFVTAFDRYALRAFEEHAVDYLLKPFDDDRFERALDHVRRRLREHRAERLEERLRALLESSGRAEVSATAGRSEPGASREETAEPARISVRRGDRIILVDTSEIDWLEAAGDYVRVHVGDATYLARSTLSGLDGELGRDFVRVHRSAIVRIDRIRELRPTGSGDHELVLEGGTTVRLSRTYRERLASALGVEL